MGVSVDAAGKIWAASLECSNAMRIDPNGGEAVERDGVTNHIGLVDLVVDLGDGTFHTGQYAGVAAAPYNYSDMTGFNNHIVNPGGQPLKGHWTVVDDSGMAGGFWHAVSWSNYLPAGCSVEVHVRASDDRVTLAHEAFLAVSNDVPFTGVNGRYIEVRVALTRTNASQQPVLYDLTLHGLSTVWAEAGYVDYSWPVHEGDDVEFWPVVDVPGPLGYQWYALYPWANDFVLLDGETNATLVSTNVDSFDDGSSFSVVVTSTTGESLFLEPAELFVGAVGIDIPASGSSGPASRYPATIDVFGQPTNFNRVSVSVTVWGLGHQRSADLSILLVSPAGTNIMLMSNVGGTNGVNGAVLSFRQGWSPPVQSGAIPTGGPWPYGPSNYGGETQMPQVGTDPPPAHTGLYSTNLDDMQYDSPNGRWKLYIYDRNQGMVGELTGSWQLNFDFQ
jgi:subtilisin-like proprotein convertase family protein